MAVIPGRFSRRRDRKGGSEVSVESLKDGAGKEDIYRCSKDGRELKMSVNSNESIVPPGLHWRKSV